MPPYSPIRQAGNLYFVSGQIGINPISKSAQPSVTDQTTQALTNLAQVLAGAGLTLRDVVKTTVFLTDMTDFAAMNDAYADHFETPRPARSTVAVKELPRLGGNTPLLVEIEAIATQSAATTRSTS
jgi:2-iminobutanoate/2-iminopropanoate deaminase